MRSQRIAEQSATEGTRRQSKQLVCSKLTPKQQERRGIAPPFLRGLSRLVYFIPLVGERRQTNDDRDTANRCDESISLIV